ncbi:MAG: hypothetical protein A2017_17670 [Lentisphaerae bacterium GWF2_44_16]|nr:MAG: hypothetical protein A2017_17670 [Lentisphaerae bacterium GWF2_44_16]HAU65838.1 hypothetical protein [Candidatus Uhrbacteria bacterium]
MGNKVTKSKYLSKKTGKEIDVVDPDFDIFFEKFGKKIEKEDSNTDTVFQEVVETMGILLRHHPFFISEVTRIRDEFDLPKNGIMSTQHLLWLSENKQRAMAYFEATHILVSKFEIPPEIRKSIIRFIEDHVLFNKKEALSPNKTELRLMTKGQVIQDLDSVDAVYLQVTPTTSIREVKKYLSRLQKTQDEKSKKRYGVPRIDPLGAIAWSMYRKGSEIGEIKSALKEVYKKRNGGILMEGDVRRLRDRFKKALNKIYPVK